MKIKVVGNGFTWTSRPNTSFVVNEEMLIDTPESLTKFIFGKIDLSKIKYILITHFHSDHFVDLHIISDFFRHEKNLPRVKVVAPKSALKRLVKLAKIIEIKRSKNEILKYLDFIEVKPCQKISLGNYEIETFQMQHKTKHSLGFVVKQENKKIGFTGDTSFCPNLKILVEKSDVIFLDCSGTEPSKNHLCVEEVLQLKKQYPKKKFHAVHVSDEILNKHQKQLDIPNCDQVLEF